jgi:hypothetical protein
MSYSSKSKETISVKDYGAKGDGITDDTTAIQNALNSNLNVFIPTGTYLISSSLILRSSQLITGSGQGAILKATANSIIILSATSISNFHISQILIDGGGQTSNVSTGIAAVVGIQVNGGTFFSIRNVRIKNCGIAHAGNITVDAGFGGYGILVTSLAGITYSGTIDSCHIENIAGGGNNTGDGVYIGGQNANVNNTTHGINIINTRVSAVGRHCFTVAEGGGTSIPTDISFVNCYGEKAALSGIDFESGNNIIVSDSQFALCGNDQTYYNPAVVYGATYRLMCGIATDNNSQNVSVMNSHVSGCYYGITWGATDGFSLTNVKVNTSTTSDVFTGLAASPRKLRVSGCEFNSALALDPFVLQNSSAGVVSNTIFLGQPKLSAPDKTTFTGCVFAAGLAFRASGGGNLLFDACTWTDYAGEAVYHANVSYSVADVQFVGCKFIGNGNLTNGISLQFDSALRWSVVNCQFYNLTGAAIICANGDAKPFMTNIIGNTVRSCANGFVTTINGAINSILSSNYFESITGWCIDFSGIGNSGGLNQVSIANNMAGAGVVNGLRIATTTGAWDFCHVVNNNWHNASTTKQSLSGGNGNGINTGNITT